MKDAELKVAEQNRYVTALELAEALIETWHLLPSHIKAQMQDEYNEYQQAKDWHKRATVTFLDYLGS